MGEYVKSPYWKQIAQQDLPFIPTPIDLLRKTFQFLHSQNYISPKDRLVDLGAGDGRIILMAAQEFGLNATGLEINNELLETTNQKIQEARLEAKCQILEADLYDFDLQPFKVIFIYLIPTSYPQFQHSWNHIQKGTFVVGIRWPLTLFEKDLNLLTTIGNERKNEISIFVYQKIR